MQPGPRAPQAADLPTHRPVAPLTSSSSSGQGPLVLLKNVPPKSTGNRRFSDPAPTWAAGKGAWREAGLAPIIKSGGDKAVAFSSGPSARTGGSQARGPCVTKSHQPDDGLSRAMRSCTALVARSPRSRVGGLVLPWLVPVIPVPSSLPLHLCLPPPCSPPRASDPALLNRTPETPGRGLGPTHPSATAS